MLEPKSTGRIRGTESNVMPNHEQTILERGLRTDGWNPCQTLADGTVILKKIRGSLRMYITPSGEGIRIGESRHVSCLLDRREIQHYKKLGENALDCQKKFDFAQGRGM